MSRPSGPIALLVSSMEGGGAQRASRKLANTIATSGRAVDLVLPRATGPFLAEVDPAVRLVDLRARRVLTSLPALVRYLRRERPRAMVSALNYVNIVAICARWLARVDTALVVTERNILTRSAERRPPSRRRVMPHLMRWLYPRADSVVTVAQGVKDDLVEFVGLSPAHVEVIYNPIVTEELMARAARPVDHPWLAPGTPPVILGVGSLTAQKDFPTLIRADRSMGRTCRFWPPERTLSVTFGGSPSTLIQKTPLSRQWTISSKTKHECQTTVTLCRYSCACWCGRRKITFCTIVGII